MRSAGLVAVLRQHRLDRGAGRGRAEVIGEDSAGVRDDPYVEHLRGVLVLPRGRVAAVAELDACDGTATILQEADPVLDGE
jgi:hypothetical protein